MHLPNPRGDLSAALFAVLPGNPRSLPALPSVDRVDDDDAQIALFVLQELSFERVDRVDPAWEEEPSALGLRSQLERRLERELRETLSTHQQRTVAPGKALLDLIARADGPSLSTWIEANATLHHFREFVVHRSAYQLKEADPHSFAIPRLRAGAAKAALLEIQLDEYGRTEPREAHAELFRSTMHALGLDGEPTVDALPTATLRTNTVLNMFGRSRRLVGACLGHLAVFEMTSVEPMARYAATLRRLLPGARGTQAARFYDVHVAADGLHERIALDELVAGFASQYPDEAAELVFGAEALMHVEDGFARHVLDCWRAGHSSLLLPIDDSVLGLPRTTAA